MVTNNRCATQQELSQLLDDVNHAPGLEHWIEHLEHCSRCHETLSVLAAPVTLWDESREQLSSIEDSLDFEDDLPFEETKLAHYRVEGTIGYGGMATVYRGFDPQLHRAVAIKVLHNHLSKTGTSRQRFLREAQSAAAITHPNVIPIHGVHQSNGKTFLVMPLVTGGSLQQRIDREGPLDLEETLQIALQIAEALEAAHARGLIHRDVKPANILLEDGNKRVVLSDFGLARTLDDASITASGLIAGTPAYMSPEQSKGESVDHRSDLYSLGSVLFAMFTGHSPFQATSTLKLLRDVSNNPFPSVHRYQEQLPKWLDRLISRLTASSPDARIQTAGEAAALIRECLLHVTNASHPIPKSLAHRPPKTWVGMLLLATALTIPTWIVVLTFLNMKPTVYKEVVVQPTNRPSSVLSGSPAKSMEWNDPFQEEIRELRNDLERLLSSPIFIH